MNAHPYSVRSECAGDAECPAAHLASPCYGGPWWNMTAARTKERALFAAVSSGNQLVLDGADPADTGAYHDGSAAAVAAPSSPAPSTTRQAPHPRPSS